MNVIKTDIEGLLIIEPKVFGDERGYFMESYNGKRYIEAGIDVNFIQDNESLSSYGVIRGLHYQIPPYSQAKLVRVISGRVIDVALDIRAGSPTFGKHFSVELTGENKRQFFIPAGFAHGFAVLSETAVFSYKCDNYYAPDYERGIRFDDPALNIDWRVPKDKTNLSSRDKMHPFLRDAEPVL